MMVKCPGLYGFRLSNDYTDSCCSTMLLLFWLGNGDA